MKKLKFLLYCLLMLGAPIASFAQAPEQQCPNAISVCQPFYSQPNSYVGFGATQELNATNQGCLLTAENNDVWYVINITSSGLLAFTIQANNISNDYDFGLWNVTGQGCQAIYNGLLPIRCDYAPANTTGSTGCSNTIVGSGWQPALPVLVGETYILNVSNYSSTQFGYTLDFGPSTATIFDTIKPKFVSAGASCGLVNDRITVTMSEPVKCNSIAANGSDYYVMPGNIPATVATGTNCTSTITTTYGITVQFASTLAPGSYWLHVHPGTDANTVFDNCGNQQSVNDSIQFIMNAANPPAMVKLDTPACIKARVVLDRRVKCTTVAADGSDFKITGPGSVNVILASPVDCDSLGMADTIDIFFDKSIPVPGLYTLSVVNGTDNNGITDTCNVGVANTISWTVTDKGYVTGTASPNLLCERNYIQLIGISSIAPPPLALSCGVHNTKINGTPSVVSVGTGTTTIAANMPLLQSFEGSRTQMLYSLPELGAAGLQKGTISKLALTITKASTYSYRDFTIKMACTNDTVLTGYLNNLQTVFNPKTVTPPAGTNILWQFNLDQTYDWDSTSSLVVEICWANNAGEKNAADQVQYTSLPVNRTYHKYKNTPNTGCNGLTNITGNGGASGDRANMKFYFTPPSQPAPTYLWTPTDYIGDTTAALTNAFVSATKTYQIQIIDSNSCYRRDTANVIVSVRNPQIIKPAKDTALCIGNSVQLIAAGGVTYSWSPATDLSCTNCPDPIATPKTTTTYTVSIADQYNCSDDTSRTITIHPLPIVDAGKDTTIIYGSQIPLFVNAPGGLYYVWNPIIGLSNPNAPDPYAYPKVTTIYKIRVIDTNQCENFDSIKITVRTDIPVVVPNAFSPNGDGHNDVFRITNVTFQKLLEFRVYDRWGNEVFSTTDPKKGWDGTYKGTPQEMGTYQYLIRVAWPTGTTETYKGDVTLVR